MINYELLFAASMAFWLATTTVYMAEALNGATDACNGASAAASTGIFTPRQALLIIAVSNAAGALIAVFVLNTNIAKVIGADIVKSEAVSLETITAAMAGIIGWASLAWWMGWPISKSHSLVGALCGAAAAKMGLDGLISSGLIKVAIGFFIGPVTGFLAGYYLGLLMAWLSKQPYPWVKKWLNGIDYSTPILPGQITPAIWWTQLIVTSLVGLAHGAGDATKFMGIESLVLYKAGITSSFVVPNEVVFLCAIVMALGTLLGGWRITHSVGSLMVNQHNRPLRGMAAETAAGMIINTFTVLGIPASTTLVFVPAIAGANYAATKRDVSRSHILYFVAAWVYTFPATFAIGYYLSL